MELQQLSYPSLITLGTPNLNEFPGPVVVTSKNGKVTTPLRSFCITAKPAKHQFTAYGGTEEIRRKYGGNQEEINNPSRQISSAGPKTRFRQKLVVKMTVGLKLLGFSRTSFELIFGCSCDLIRDSNRKLKELSFGPFQSQNGHTFDEM